MVIQNLFPRNVFNGRIFLKKSAENKNTNNVPKKYLKTLEYIIYIRPLVYFIVILKCFNKKVK
jgi:hypothetical protein